MPSRIPLTLALSTLLLAACGGSSNSDRAVPTAPSNNSDGSPVTGVLTACFDPANANGVGHPCRGAVPLPNNLLLSGTNDLTLNPPVANPNNFGDPTVAIGTLDGWSTVGPMSTSFNASPNPSSIVPGQTVRVFEVPLTGPGGGTTGIVRELAGGTEFVTAMAPSDASGRTLAIIPTQPLQQLTSYLVVLTDGIRDSRGNNATPDQVYNFTKRSAPLCANGQSTDPLLPTATACALEPLRQLTNSHLAVAGAAGIARDRVVSSWVFTTQSITPVMQAVRSITEPGAAQIVPTGMTIAHVVEGMPPIADVHIGTLQVPYYLSAPSAANPTAPLNQFWRAAPGAYVPPFNQAGLSPASTNITFANPFPVKTADVNIPVLAIIPNAASGRTKPATGWPVVIFQHGITGNRTHAFAVSATLASQGFAVIAIDLPLHGLPPESPLAIGNTPFGAIASERTFNADYVNNETGAPGQDGIPDDSGTHFINLGSLLTSRDNLRQAVADLFVLTATIPWMDLDGNGTGDFDSSNVQFVGLSLGAIVGTSFLALEPTVNVGMLSAPGGGIARLLHGSATFGPRIQAGLRASGVEPGTPTYDSFMGAAQQVIDSIDPINYGFVTAQNAILLHEVVGGDGSPADQVVPNSVAGAPLSGTEPLIRAMGLSAITQTTQAANGIRGVTRFTSGEHASLIRPTAPAVTAEMQGQMASLLLSSGTAVLVQDPSVIRAQ
ncbi:Ig-like domain-containing protein [Xanthomonadaceae bacterium JHOS43]|nr:Ig-like domain-containing protein [Xanthomonadaceae bacterium JHOS43]MCX7562257.1 Ig-like domain-containing protein [Xanthomonadaceae bacterium XH05]